MNFATLLDLHARAQPDSVALYCGEQAVTWGALRDRVLRTQAGLTELGLRDGDRAAMLMGNTVDHAVALLATMRMGAIPTLLNVRWTADDVRFALDDSGSAALLCDAEFSSLAQELRTEGRVGTVVVSDGEAAAAEAPGTTTFAALARTPLPDRPIRAVGRQNREPADIMYTSGSTARPKGAIHPHGYHFATVLGLAGHFGMTQADVGIVQGPMYHTAGQVLWALGFALGHPLVLIERWDPQTWLAAVERHRVSYLHLVGTLMVDLVNRGPELLNRHDTSSVRVTLVGGGTVPEQMLRDYEDLVGGVVCGGYGRTEGGFFWEPPDRALRDLTRNGRCVRDIAEGRVVVPGTSIDAEPNTTGEIILRGDGLATGYWNRPEINADLFDAEGWMRTGDLGVLDDTGRLDFQGRLDHMIKSGGENVHPAEVETVLMQMPQIADAAVVGIPHERLGQTVAALVVPRDAVVTEEIVVEWCRERLAGFRRPRVVVVADALPRLGSTKTDYLSVRAQILKTVEGS